MPSPRHASQRPPLTLKLKRPFYSLVPWLHLLPQRHHEYHQKHLYMLLGLNEVYGQLVIGQYRLLFKLINARHFFMLAGLDL